MHLSTTSGTLSSCPDCVVCPAALAWAKLTKGPVYLAAESVRRRVSRKPFRRAGPGNPQGPTVGVFGNVGHAAARAAHEAGGADKPTEIQFFSNLGLVISDLQEEHVPSPIFWEAILL